MKVTIHSPVITSRFPSGVVIQFTKSVARGDHKRKNMTHEVWIALRALAMRGTWEYPCKM